MFPTIFIDVQAHVPPSNKCCPRLPTVVKVTMQKYKPSTNAQSPAKRCKLFSTVRVTSHSVSSLNSLQPRLPKNKILLPMLSSKHQQSMQLRVQLHRVQNTSQGSRLCDQFRSISTNSSRRVQLMGYTGPLHLGHGWLLLLLFGVFRLSEGTFNW